MTARVAIVWLRRDLRLADQPALTAAIANAERILPLYIHAGCEADPPPGGASNWWLHHSLNSLREAFTAAGSRLYLDLGPSSDTLLRWVRATGASTVFCTAIAEPWAERCEREVAAALAACGCELRVISDGLLTDPHAVRNRSGGSYRAFTPFWRNLRARLAPPHPQPAPQALPPPPTEHGLESQQLATLDLIPPVRWDLKLGDHWQPGVVGAERRLAELTQARINDYPQQRDLPAQPGTSRLSPHLHFGEVSVRQIWHAVTALVAAAPEVEEAAERFLSELGWREFAYHLLAQHPALSHRPIDARFARFPWRDDPDDRLLQAWQEGRTGIPLVDAGMRELWASGWMHNRVRMVVGSFLVKNLRLPWQLGEAYFRDTLADWDLAANSMGWQWVTGCGADAAPYFRVFNPVRQGERFDPHGEYVRRWLPELKAVPAASIHHPWTSSAEVLDAAGVRLGETYPLPLIDLADSRREALAAFRSLD